MSKCSNCSKDRFYNEIIQEKLGTDELRYKWGADYAGLFHSRLYELCQKYVNIGLNSQKFKGNDESEIVACFQFSDINIAKDETKRYIEEFEIENKKDFIQFLSTIYWKATDDDEKRIVSTMLPSENNSDYGICGHYFTFNLLPDDIWETIANDVLEN